MSKSTAGGCLADFGCTSALFSQELR